ncbi:MAG: ferredoxin [Nocardioides sp.]
MSRIVADHAACEGIGMCETTAHEMFVVGDDGLVEVLQSEPDDVTLARAAVAACPVSALRLQD